MIKDVQTAKLFVRECDKNTPETSLTNLFIFLRGCKPTWILLGIFRGWGGVGRPKNGGMDDSKTEGG